MALSSNLRDYQHLIIRQILERYRQGASSALIVAPTGSGKTLTFLSLVRQILSERPDLRVVFMVNRIRLVSQLERTMHSVGFGPEDVGVVSSSLQRRELSRQFTVASYLSIINVSPPIPYHLIIWDEAHRFAEMLSTPDHPVAGWYSALCKINSRVKSVGFTATPYDSRRMITSYKTPHFTEIDFEVRMRQMLEEGHLCPMVTYAGSRDAQPDLAGCSKAGHDWALADVERITSDSALRSRQVSDALVRLDAHQRRHAIWQCASIRHACDVFSELTSRGETVALVHSEQKHDIQTVMLEGFESGALRHLVFVTIISEGYDCFDDATEILTVKGWMGIDSVKTGDEIYTYNKDLDALEVLPVENYFSRQLRKDEKMYGIKSQHLDFLMTENHNILYKKKARVAYGPIRTDSIKILVERASPFTIPLAAKLSSSSVSDYSKDLLYILGILWTDGWMSSTGGFQLFQSKPLIIKKIETALLSLNIQFTKNVRKTRGPWKSNYGTLTTFKIPKGTGRGLDCLGKDLFTKRPHESLLDLNEEQFFHFWEGLVDGNGSVSKNPNKAPMVTLCNKEQVDFIMHLCARLGLTSMYGYRLTKINKVPVYTLRVRKRRWHGLVPKDPRGAKFYCDDSYRGRVWCVSTRNESVVARRNGKVAILGNCPPIDSVVLLCPTRSPVKMVQTLGRAMRPAALKQYALLLDYGRVVEHCGPVDFPFVRQRQATRERESIDGVECDFPQVLECHQCGHIQFGTLEPTSACATCSTSLWEQHHSHEHTKRQSKLEREATRYRSVYSDVEILAVKALRCSWKITDSLEYTVLFTYITARGEFQEKLHVPPHSRSPIRMGKARALAARMRALGCEGDDLRSMALSQRYLYMPEFVIVSAAASAVLSVHGQALLPPDIEQLSAPSQAVQEQLL